MTGVMTKAPEKPLATKAPPSNEDGIKMLRSQKFLYSAVFWTSTATATLVALAISTPGALLFGVTFSAANVISKCTRILAIFEMLLEEFRDDGIIGFPALMIKDAAEHEHIDLYVRFPKRTQLFINIRSEEGRSVVYNEAKEKLQVKKGKKKGMADMRPCPLTILNKGKNWLNKNRQTFGLTSRQVTKVPTIRVLVLWGNTQLMQHRDELYSEINGNKYLSVQKDRATTFVVKQENLATFIRDWLSQCAS